MTDIETLPPLELQEFQEWHDTQIAFTLSELEKLSNNNQGVYHG